MAEMFSVYMIRRLDTGEPQYVGRTNQPEKRWRLHLVVAAGISDGRPPQRATAWLKELARLIRAGIRCEFVLLARGLDKREAGLLERSSIARIGRRLDGTGPLWNVYEGGNLTRGDMLRAGLISNRKGMSPSLETRAKIRAANTGRALPADARAKISAAMRAMWADAECRAGRIEAYRRALALRKGGGASG